MEFNLPRQSGSRTPGSSTRSKSSAFFRRIKVDVESEYESLRNMYNLDNLNFYDYPPTYSISLEEFEQYAVERYKLLKIIERYNLSCEHTTPITVRYTSNYFYTLKGQIEKEKEVPTYHTLLNNIDKDTEEHLQALKVDHIAHFLLRLAFSRTDEHRKWLIALEVDFFRLKLHKIQKLNPVLQKYKLPFEKVSEEVKGKFSSEISNATFTMAPQTMSSALTIEVYKVHFTHALDLVRSRKVFLHMGYAYVPYNELAIVIALKFRSYLSESLSLLKKNIHLVDNDERLRPLVTEFEKRHLGCNSSIVKTGDFVNLEELSTFSHKSFPLCMKYLYDVVEKEHHLKHWGRLQLGLFFKGLGLPIDEATKFWRSNFTKRPEIDASRFDKQYLYNVRHMYGQEGKRADYTPYSCLKIINSSVGPGDHHGCPFRHSDATPLTVKLVEAGISQEGIKEIIKLVEEKHYQIACQRYFEWTHEKQTIDGGVHHPNQYFLESRNVLTGKKTIKSQDKQETKRVVVYAQTQPSQKQESMDVEENNPQEELDNTDNDDIFMLASMEY